MKLTSVTLSDIRRFTAPVRVEGIAGGLNVLCAPNEEGKSTLFDALQALFFQPHRSKAKEIAALRPHAGGAPLVMAEVTTAEGTFRIVKRWLNRPMAEVWQGARLLAKADEAEVWIAALTQGKGDGGPAGLLWVRQGLTALDQGSAREKEAAQGARRDLMSSITGEVESLTGGRRMDLAIAKCREDLDRYVTGTGRAKAGGPLKEAEDQVAGLTQRKAELAGLVAALADNLARRRAARRALAEIRAPQALAERRARLQTAVAALDAAQRHAEQITRAQEAVAMAGLRLTEVSRKLSALLTARGELEAAGLALGQATEFAAEAQGALALSEQALVADRAAAEAARADLNLAEAALRQALRAETARSAQARRAELADRLARVAAAEAALERDRGAASAGPDAATLARLEKATQEVAVLQNLRISAAPDIAMHYAAGVSAAVLLDGAPLAEGIALPIPDGAELELAGLGRLSIRPGKGGDGTGELTKAQAALAAALAAVDQADMTAARAAATLRAEAGVRLAEARATLAGLAPGGAAALRAEFGALPDAPAAEDEAPDIAAAQAAADRCGAARDRAETALEAARRRADQDRQMAARAAAARESAEARCNRAARAMEAFGDAAGLEAGLTAEREQAEARLAAAETACQALTGAAPDLEAAMAAANRARSVVDTAEEEARRLESDLAQLDAVIDLRSGEGVEEELADVTARLEAAEGQLALLRLEVDVLQELAAALDAARATARDRYFEPVLTALRPLLRLLWPDADLRFDGDSILPAALTRHGQEEPIDVLSGGTREQIAFLVRLAFAHMLAASGRHAPVILDDALVYTDDDRIERMFDALHRQADDVQIIVLSCRQRAFRDLGGRKLAFAACALPPELH